MIVFPGNIGQNIYIKIVSRVIQRELTRISRLRDLNLVVSYFVALFDINDAIKRASTNLKGCFHPPERKHKVQRHLLLNFSWLQHIILFPQPGTAQKFYTAVNKTPIARLWCLGKIIWLEKCTLITSCNLVRDNNALLATVRCP